MEIQIEMSKLLARTFGNGRVLISNFRCERYVNNDHPNVRKHGQIECKYYSQSDSEEPALHIGYRPYIGQIGILYSKPKYRGTKLGTQAVEKAMEEMKKLNTREVWAVSVTTGRYWRSLPGFEYRDPAHYSVGAEGFYRSLDSYDPSVGLLNV